MIAGSGFDASIAPLRIQGAALGLTFAISGLGFALLARHRQRVLLACNLLVFVVSAVAVALLAAAHGARGAALGAAIGEATLCAAYALALTRGAPGIRPRACPGSSSRWPAAWPPARSSRCRRCRRRSPAWPSTARSPARCGRSRPGLRALVR